MKTKEQKTADNLDSCEVGDWIYEGLLNGNNFYWRYFRKHYMVGEKLFCDNGMSGYCQRER